MNEHYSSVKSEDIYDDLDYSLSPEPICMDNSFQEGTSEVSDFTNASNITMTNNTCTPSTSNFSLNEDQLKKEEWRLYLDLVESDLVEKKISTNIKAEYAKLRKETDCLRKSLNEKDEKIAQLTAQINNLKKNICSLYKTAKSEIEQKDAMLLEANRKIDKIYNRSQCQLSPARMSGDPVQNYNQYEAHSSNKEDRGHNNNKRRNYEVSKSENQTFSGPSTSFNPSERNSNWNQDNSKHIDHSSSNESEGCNNNKRRNYEGSKSENQTFSRPSTSFNPPERNSKWNQSNSNRRHPYKNPKHGPPSDAVNEKCNSYNYADKGNNFNRSNNRNNQRYEKNFKKQNHYS